MIEVVEGTGPLVLGLPHTGTDVPPDMWDGLNDTGRALADTDWNIHKLYNGLRDDVTTVRTPIHRYVIDVNRPPDDASLYPGQNTTGLCPETDFDGRPIHAAPVTGEEVEARRQRYHAPYHAALAAQLARVRARHGVAILYDCHSIRSVIPHLFEGTLPDFNIGTDGGRTCAPQVSDTVAAICRSAKGYSTVVNGRFKGGWTTRHYGRPGDGVHAIQMELAQATYMHEAPPWDQDPARAEAVRGPLRQILDALTTLAISGELT